MINQLFYFTGTGNGLHLAKSIKSHLEKQGDTVALTAINTLNLNQPILTSADRVGIIYPTYAMSAPRIIKTFAGSVQVKEDTYVFLYAHNGGGGSGGAITEVANRLTDRGITVSSSYETVFPSNSSIFKYTDEKLAIVLAKSEVTIKENVENIASHHKKIWKRSNAVREATLKLHHVVMSKFEDYMGFSEIEADHNCISCGLCSKVCPLQNIEMKGQPEFKSNCEMCLSCVNNCPKKSLAYKKMNRESFKPYRHPEVKVKELMYR